MALSSVSSLNGLPGIGDGVWTDVQLAQALDAAEAAVQGYCHRQFAQATYTDYYDGTGTPDLPLRQRPVISVTSVSLDLGGYYGKATNAFAASTLLTEGLEYVLDYTPGGAGQSKSGLLIRLGGGTAGTTLSGVWPEQWRRGTLTARLNPVWPIGRGCVKVVYSAGYVTIPQDVIAAVNQLAAWNLRNPGYGGRFLQGESWNGYSYSLAALQTQPELGSCRDLLSRYRELTV